MKPINFTKYETIFKGNSPDIDDLPTKVVQYGADGTIGIISCWKPSFLDWLRLIIGKPIYLIILGKKQPPVLLSTDARDIGALDDDPSHYSYQINYDEETGEIL